LTGSIPRVEDRQDVGVLECGSYTDFVEEAVGPNGSRELSSKHLERDRAVMAKVVREVHRRHAAPAELTLDAVTVSQGGCEGFSDIRQ
jgi:hypothetical protein